MEVGIMLLDNVKYTQEHEWVLLEDDIATIGISSHAIEELGDIVFVELPKVGSAFSQMDELGTVESVKTVSSLYIPLSGSIVEVNETLQDAPEMVNEAPYGDGWLIKVKIDDRAEYDDLMTSEEYEAYLESL
jgi:glycine cleavage system H protein